MAIVKNLRGKIISREAVTPNDSTILNYEALWIGVGGDLNVKFEDDTVDDGVFKNVPTGSYLVGGVIKVKSTNTTCSSIMGLRIGK